MPLPTNYDVFITRFEVPAEEASQHRFVVYRRKVFVDWLDEHKQHWFMPNLDPYAQHLKDARQLSAYSVNSYLGSVRSAYREMLQDETSLRRELEGELSSSEATKAIELIRVASHRDTATQKASRPKASHQHLSVEEVEEVLNSIDTSSIKGTRDLALIAMLFATGLRDVELAALEVTDVFYVVDGKRFIHVPACSQCEERLIDLGKMEWVLRLVEEWLREAGIQEGPVFRRFRKGEAVDKTALSPRGVFAVVEEYLNRGGEKITLLDIRYSYARTLYKAGVPIEQIQANLGHKNIQTTAEYIGKLDGIDPNPRIYKPRGIPPFQIFHMEEL